VNEVINSTLDEVINDCRLLRSKAINYASGIWLPLKKKSINPVTPVINTTINSALNPRTSSHSYGLSDRNNEQWFVCESATVNYFSVRSPSLPAK